MQPNHETITLDARIERQADLIRMTYVHLTRRERRLLRRLYAAGAVEGGLPHPMPQLHRGRDTGAYLASLGLLIPDGTGSYFLSAERFLYFRKRWRVHQALWAIALSGLAGLLLIWMTRTG